MSLPAQACVTRLEEIVGGAYVLTDSVELSARQVDGKHPSAVVQPAEVPQVAEILRFAAAEKLAAIPSGGCTKLGIGAPPLRYDIALDLSRMSRVLAYDPRDLTLGVEPGVRIEELLRTLEEEKQFLPLAVPFSDRATIGGIVAANSSSPLRHSYGGVRDFCLGMEFVTGDGNTAKSGGRVVKNVTGYDLHKLLIGSLGTLAVITRLNFRTFPSVIAGSRGFVASFSNPQGALALRRTIAQSPLSPLTFDIVSPGLARIFSEKTPTTPETAVFSGEARDARHFTLPPIGDWFHPREWQLCAAFAGPPEVLDRYTRDLTRFATE